MNVCTLYSGTATNVFYEQNIKNNSNFSHHFAAFSLYLHTSTHIVSLLLCVDSKERNNGWKATYAYTLSHIHIQTYAHIQRSHHKKKSKKQILFLSSYDWDFIGCKVIPTVFLSTRHVLSAFHRIQPWLLLWLLLLLVFSVLFQKSRARCQAKGYLSELDQIFEWHATIETLRNFDLFNGFCSFRCRFYQFDSFFFFHPFGFIFSIAARIFMLFESIVSIQVVLNCIRSVVGIESWKSKKIKNKFM